MKPNIKNAPQFKCLTMTLTLSGLLSLLACLSGCSSGTSTGGSQFEGVITVKYYDTFNLDRATFSFKGSLYRSETINTGGVTSPEAVIVDYKSGIQKQINQTEKNYYEIDMRRLDESFKDLIPLPKFTPTGKTETLAGYICEHYLIDDQQKTDMCFAEGLGYIGSADDFHRGGIWQFFKQSADEQEIKARMDSDPVFKKLIVRGAFPLKISAVENGREKTVMEVIAIERKSLDDSLFQVPAGYKKVESPLFTPQSNDEAGN